MDGDADGEGHPAIRLVDGTDVLAARGGVAVVVGLRSLAVDGGVGQRRVRREVGLGHRRRRRGHGRRRGGRDDHLVGVARVQSAQRHRDGPVHHAVVGLRHVQGRVRGSVVPGPADGLHGHVHRLAEHGRVDPGHLHRVRAAGWVGEQDSGLAFRGVERGQALQGVEHVRLRRRHGHGVAGELAVPVHEPPLPVRLVVADGRIGVVIGDVPERQVGVDLRVLELGEQLHHLTGHGQLVPVRVLVDVDRDRRDAAATFEREEAGVVGGERLLRAGLEHVPGDDVRQHVVGLGVAEEVAHHGRVVHGGIGAGDKRARVVGAYPLEDRGPVLFELGHLGAEIGV